MPTSALAEIDPPPVGPQLPEDGVWIQLTVVKNTTVADVAVQLGQLGGNRISYGALQLERHVTPRVAVSVAYARGGLRIDNAPDLPLNLVRVGATWSSGSHPVELDARLWGELLVPDRGRTIRQGRLRLRVSVDVPNTLPALHPRLFVANEVFATTDNGFTRNRASAGLRTQPAHSIFFDVAYQRTDDATGLDQNVALVQLTRVF